MILKNIFLVIQELTIMMKKTKIHNSFVFETIITNFVIVN